MSDQSTSTEGEARLQPADAPATSDQPTLLPLVIPLTNLNGTSRAVLIDQCMRVRNGLDMVMVGLRDAAPHGRDFQTMPDPDASYRQARAAWEQRHEMLARISADYYDLAFAIDSQGRR